jgi:hypothetical protein
MELTEREFERRLVAHGHDVAEARNLWAELVETEETDTARRGLSLGATIAVYLGLLLFVAASAAFLGWNWELLDPWGVLALGLAYFVGLLVASEALRTRRYVQTAGVLETAAVLFVPAIAYAVERIAGIWPAGASESTSLHHGLTVITLAGLAVGVVLLAVRPTPFLLAPLGVGTVVLAVDVAELAWGTGMDDLSVRQIGAFLLPVGLAWIAAGLWLDATRRRDYATWAHWVGVVTTAYAIILMLSPLDQSNRVGFVVIGLLGAASLFFSAFVRHWSFTVVGIAGVLLAVSGGLRTLGNVAPLGVAALGLVLVLVGLRWSRWRETVRHAVLAWLPARLRDGVARLAP